MIVSQEREFHIPESMTPTELGEHLARLVWESFTDVLTDEASLDVLGRLGVLDADGRPNGRAAEEALIYLLWAHTRGIQQAYLGRGSRLARAALDELHRAVFEDMAANGSSPGELPLFEQRVSARYAQYRQAAEESDLVVGAAVIQSITGAPPASPEDAQLMADWAIGVTRPVSDFYTDVELVEG